MNNLVVRFSGAAVLIGGLVGYKFYRKSADHDEVRNQAIAACQQDSTCVAAVETHFDSCFETHYRMGGRRQGASLDGDALVACIMENADRGNGQEQMPAAQAVQAAAIEAPKGAPAAEARPSK